MSDSPAPPLSAELRQAQPIDAYVVPTPDAAAVFFDVDLSALRPSAPAFRLDVYSPFDLSEGEMEYLRAALESDVVAYAAGASRQRVNWGRALLLGAADLVLLGLLLAFTFINSDRSFLIFFWVFAVALLPGPIAGMKAVRSQRVANTALRILDTPVVAAVSGRAGAGTAAVKAIWNGRDGAVRGRDLGALQEECRTAGWEAGVRFYRRLRYGDAGHAGPVRPFWRRLVGLFGLPARPVEIPYVPCRTS